MTGIVRGRSPRVAVPLLAVHAAYRLAKERGDVTLQAALDKALKVVRRTCSGSQFLAAVKERGARDVLPFVRDAADVSVACAFVRIPAGVEKRLFSEVSGADLGFIQVWEDGFAYVDRAPPPRDTGRTIVEMMAPSAMSRLLTSLQQLDATPASVIVAEDPSFLLEVASEMLEAWAVSIAPMTIALVRPRGLESSGQALRSLGSCQVEVVSPGRLAIRVPASVAMEVHAAALAGYWLELSAPGIRLLSPLPEFSPGNRVDAWLQPKGAFSQAVGGEVGGGMTLPRDLALDLCRRHRWCLPSDLDVCLDAVEVR